MKHVLFVLIYSLFVSYGKLYAEPSETNGTRSNAQLTPLVETAHHIPTGSNKTQWNPFLTVGAKAMVPTTVKLVDCIAGVEIGEISHKTSGRYVQVLHLSVGFLMKDLIHYRCLEMLPTVALTNMMVGDSQGKIGASSSHIFSDVENEFGVRIGIVPCLRWGRLVVMAPVYGERIFSSPETFSMVSFSLGAGYLFSL